MINSFLTEKIKENFGFVPTTEQSEVIHKMGQFLTSHHDMELFLLRGYAGAAEFRNVSLTDDFTTYVLTVMNEIAGFYKKENAFKVYNHKAYLNVPKGVAAQALKIRFNDDNGTTGIDNPELSVGNAGTNIYDLSGRRVQKATKGVYIVNGKKVVF